MAVLAWETTWTQWNETLSCSERPCLTRSEESKNDLPEDTAWLGVQLPFQTGLGIWASQDLAGQFLRLRMSCRETERSIFLSSQELGAESLSHFCRFVLNRISLSIIFFPLCLSWIWFSRQNHEGLVSSSLPKPGEVEVFLLPVSACSETC